MAEQPAGTVTLLFTDIEGSTRLLHELGPDGYRDALAEHRRLLREAFARHEGYEVDYEGDAFFVTFAAASEAVAAARQAQAALAGGPISVRMGLHTGEPLLDPPKYVGVDVHRAARIMSAGHGGQIVLSATTAALVDGEVALRDLGPHRLKDMIAAEPLFQVGDGDFPPLKSLRQTNLPIQPTPLVGREHEVAEIVEQLRERGVRLLTLTGPGGTGKTRLALQAAAELSEEFRDGIWLVDLAPLSDPDLVEPTIGQALGAKEDVADHLRGKQTLLLLDNFEQVTDAAPAVSKLLTGCADVVVLVTSRIPLRIAGEQLYPVPPLGLEEAVALFRERARAMKPDFEPDEAVAEICERLDRLPLAIELAAARVRLLSPSAMLNRLEQRLQLLTGGARDAPTRQQTLEAAIAWSYELLEPSNQRLFAELAVFKGGRTLDAVEAVCNPDGDIDVLASIESLVDASLLNQDASEDGEVRFVMLETIHEYARRCLEELPEAEERRRRHALFFHALVAEGGPRQQRARLEVEIDNLRAALDWLAQQEPDLELDMVGQLDLLWSGSGLQAEGKRRLEHALDRAPSEPTKSLWKVLSALSRRHWESGDYSASRPLAERALEVARALEDDKLIAYALVSLSADLGAVGEVDRARTLLEEAEVRAQRASDHDTLAAVRGNLAWFAITRADYEEARKRLEQLVGIARDAGDTYTLGQHLCNLGWALYYLGDPAAGENFRESLKIARRAATRDSVESISGLAAVAAAAGRENEAARMLGLANAITTAHTVQLEPFVRDIVERAGTAARAAIGDEEFDRLYAEGAAMDADEAIDGLLSAKS